MTLSERSVPLLVLAAAVLAGVGCRDVSQPALDDRADPGPLFPVEQHDEWGYVTRTGSLAVEPQFDRAYRFVGNRALVRQNGRFGYVDPSGAIVVPPTFAAAHSFSDELAPVRPDSLWGFIDRTGTLVIPPQFQFAPPTPDGPSGASSLFPNAEDSVATPLPAFVPPTPSVPQYFSENRARIRTADGWGYLNREGIIVIAPRFAWAGDFFRGRARVHLDDGRIGYVRPDGGLVWPPDRRSP